jgi:hypothetical protein
MHVRRSSAAIVASIALALAVVVAVVHAPRAAACSPDVFSSTRLDGRTQPVPGASDVGVNARVFFGRFDGPQDAPPTATLQRGDDEPTPVAVDTVPAGFVLSGFVLEPNTTYTARVDLVPLDGEGDGEGGGDAAIFEGDVTDAARERGLLVFSTGDAADTTPPSFDGVADLAIENVEGEGFFGMFVSNSCTGPQGFDVHTITPPPVDDDVAFIELSVGPPGGGAVFLDASTPGTAMNNVVFDAGELRYELVAIDVAGNRSAPLVLEAPGRLAVGCGAIEGAGRGDAASAAALFAGLALLRRRRRRG